MSSDVPFYNLLMHGNEEAWRGTSAIMPKDRLFEYTQQEVAGTFSNAGLVNFEALKTLPALFAYERYANAPARVGRIVNQLRNPEHWRPGWIAIDEQGRTWTTVAGSERDGALMWLANHEL